MMRRTRPRREQGSTLVELLVVMVVFGVIGSVVLSATLSAFRSSASTSARVDALQELELAMWQVTRDLRSADPLELVTGNYDTALGASFERGGEQRTVTYSVESVDGVDQLVRDDTGRSVVTALDNGDEPVFRYLDRFGEEISCTSTCDIDLLTTRQVTVRLVRRIADSAPAIVETQISVRNLRHGEAS